MVRQLYTAWTGMRNEQNRLDVIANNLANSATVGYKKEGVTSQSFDKQLMVKIRDASVDWRKEQIGRMSFGVKVGEVYTDYKQGSLRESGNTFDFAIDGDGFFAIEYTNANGQTSTQYTRAGQFTITKEGYVVDVGGNVYADGELVDTIVLTDFEDYDYLKKFGETRCFPVQGAREKEATGFVRQGFTEQSNVNVVSEMVNMIAITRAFEANQKVVQTVDSTLEKAVNTLGSVS